LYPVQQSKKPDAKFKHHGHSTSSCTTESSNTTPPLLGVYHQENLLSAHVDNEYTRPPAVAAAATTSIMLSADTCSLYDLIDTNRSTFLTLINSRNFFDDFTVTATPPSLTDQIGASTAPVTMELNSELDTIM
jgi:hypothetical protein